MTKLEAQINQALKLLPTKAKRFIVVPKRPRRAGGKKRHGSGRPVYTLKRHGESPWYSWSFDGPAARVSILRWGFRPSDYRWEVEDADGNKTGLQSSTFDNAVSSINDTLDRWGMGWRVKAPRGKAIR